MASLDMKLSGAIVTPTFNRPVENAVEACIGEDVEEIAYIDNERPRVEALYCTFGPSVTSKPTSPTLTQHRCSSCDGLDCSDNSDDELDLSGGTADGPAFDACEILKSLVPCSSVSERNLLADTAKIVEKNKIRKRKDDCRRIVTDSDSLSSLGYCRVLCRRLPVVLQFHGGGFVAGSSDSTSNDFFCRRI